jgi:hypothetical protein
MEYILEIVKSLLLLISSPAFVASISACDRYSRSSPDKDFSYDDASDVNYRMRMPQARAVVHSVLKSLGFSNASFHEHDLDGIDGTYAQDSRLFKVLERGQSVLLLVVENFTFLQKKCNDINQFGHLASHPLLKETCLAVGSGLLHSILKVQAYGEGKGATLVSLDYCIQQWIALIAKLKLFDMGEVHGGANEANFPVLLMTLDDLIIFNFDIHTGICSKNISFSCEINIAAFLEHHKRGQYVFHSNLSAQDLVNNAFCDRKGKEIGAYVTTITGLAYVATRMLELSSGNENSRGGRDDGNDGLMKSKGNCLITAQCQCIDIFLTLTNDTAIIDAIPLLADIWRESSGTADLFNSSKWTKSHPVTTLGEDVLWKILVLRHTTLCLALLLAPTNRNCEEWAAVTHWSYIVLAPQCTRWLHWLRELGVCSTTFTSSRSGPHQRSGLPTTTFQPIFNFGSSESKEVVHADMIHAQSIPSHHQGEMTRFFFAGEKKALLVYRSTFVI